MKRVILLIMVLTIGWGWAGAQSDNNKADYVAYGNNYQEHLDKATKKAYKKMQKAKAKYKKELSKYKQEMSLYKQEMSKKRKKMVEESRKFKNESLNTKDFEQQMEKFGEMMGNRFSKYFNFSDSAKFDNNLDTITRDFNISNFSGIKCNGIAQLIYTQGDKYSVKAEGGKLFIDNLDMKVNNGTLIIDTKDSGSMSFFSKALLQIKVYVTAPSLMNVSIGGCTSFTANEIGGDSFSISTNGVNKVKCPLIKTDKFECTASGASTINLNFSGKKAIINNVGASDIVMNVECDELDVNNSGVGSMKISGTADKTDIQSSGVSKVDIAELNKY